MNNHLNEVFGDRYTTKKAVLYSVIGSISEGSTVKHILKTENGWEESHTVANTYRDSTSSDREKVEAGMRFARQRVGNDVEVSYSNNKNIELREKNTKLIPEALNEAATAWDASDMYSKALLG